MLRPGELIHFAAWKLAVFQQYGQPVWTVVLYGLYGTGNPSGSSPRKRFE